MGFLSGGLGAIAGAVGGLASTILGNNSAKHEAQSSRDWQERMSNTSIQRRMADLKAAGINPLLAVQSAGAGASTPNGAQADIKHFDPSFITTAVNAFLAEKQAEGIDAGIEKTKAETENIRSNTLGQDLDNKIKEYQQEHSKLLIDLEKKNISIKELEREIYNSRSEQAKLEVLEKNKVLEKLDIEISNEEERNKQLTALVEILEAEAGSFGNTKAGKNIKWFMDLFTGGASLYNMTKGGIGK